MAWSLVLVLILVIPVVYIVSYHRGWKDGFKTHSGIVEGITK